MTMSASAVMLGSIASLRGQVSLVTTLAVGGVRHDGWVGAISRHLVELRKDVGLDMLLSVPCSRSHKVTPEKDGECGN